MECTYSTLLLGKAASIGTPPSIWMSRGPPLLCHQPWMQLICPSRGVLRCLGLRMANKIFVQTCLHESCSRRHQGNETPQGKLMHAVWRPRKLRHLLCRYVDAARFRSRTPPRTPKWMPAWTNHCQSSFGIKYQTCTAQQAGWHRHIKYRGNPASSIAAQRPMSTAIDFSDAYISIFHRASSAISHSNMAMLP